MTGTLRVYEAGTALDFTIEDANRYHGPGFPAAWRMASVSSSTPWHY